MNAAQEHEMLGRTLAVVDELNAFEARVLAEGNEQPVNPPALVTFANLTGQLLPLVSLARYLESVGRAPTVTFHRDPDGAIVGLEIHACAKEG